MKFRNGNIVRITRPGRVYSTYKDMAEIMGLKKYHHGYGSYNLDCTLHSATGTVVSCAFHEYSDSELFGVRLHCNNIEIIMGGEGLRLVREFQLKLQLDENLFEME